MWKALTTQEFVKKAVKVHGNTYTYLNTDYRFSRDKVIITCSQHGDFLQTPNAHLAGKGCPVCGIMKQANSIRLNTKRFINTAKQVHGNRYDYSKSIYKSARTKLIITCPYHGDFLQVAHSHLIGMRCRKCAYKENGDNRKWDTKQFVTKANKVHNNKYNYEKADYKNTKEKLIINCPAHGDFLQCPNNHLEGKGCPTCGKGVQSSKAETSFLNWVEKEFNCKLKRHHSIATKIVDGYDKRNRVVYEFLGDFWHGNPDKCNPHDTNRVNGREYWELYLETFERFRFISDRGYTIRYIWENDWENAKKQHVPIEVITFHP